MKSFGNLVRTVWILRFGLISVLTSRSRTQFKLRLDVFETKQISVREAYEACYL